MIKIVLIGAGHLGKIHLRCLQALPQWEVVGFYEPDDAVAEKVAREFGVTRYTDINDIITIADALDIVAPTTNHAEWAERGIRAGKHLFIEKPVTHSPQTARALLESAKLQPQLKIQVGHVERFNPAVRALQGIAMQPKFIEAHRLALPQPRGTDVSVVLDLMIHDLDMLLKWVDSPVSAVYANGVAILSATPDIANARIEFENGAVANLTASRISLKTMRKFRIFQPDAYISLDLLEKKTEIIRLHETPADNYMELDTANGKRYLEIGLPDIQPINAIETELSEWAQSIISDTIPTVPLAEGVKVVELAHRIADIIAVNNEKVTTQLL